MGVESGHRFGLVDVREVRGYWCAEPHRKLLYIVLLLGLKDRASEIHFAPGLCGTEGWKLRIFLVVAGEAQELVPAPIHCWAGMAQQLKFLAGWRSIRRRIARLLRSMASRIDGFAAVPISGPFRLGDDCHTVEAVVKAFPSPEGDRIVVSLTEADTALSQIAATTLWEIVKETRYRAGEVAVDVGWVRRLQAAHPTTGWPRQTRSAGYAERRWDAPPEGV